MEDNKQLEEIRKKRNANVRKALEIIRKNKEKMEKEDNAKSNKRSI